MTYQSIEVIVVNDGSTDDTGVVADALAAAHPNVIRVLHQSNTGVGLAREAGRRVAQGEFIQYLDSDDVLLPEWQRLGLARIGTEGFCALKLAQRLLSCSSAGHPGGGPP